MIKAVLVQRALASYISHSLIFRRKLLHNTFINTLHQERKMCSKAYFFQFDESLEAGFGDHISDVEKGLLHDGMQRLMKLDATNVHI